MPNAIVTDQFRILNSGNFVNSLQSATDSYYLFLGLSNPSVIGFGRTSDWDSNTPDPYDDFSSESHVRNNILFAKKITSENVRRLVRRIDWIQGTRYEMYRHDYNIDYPSPLTQSTRLYDANYYVMNDEYKVYLCVDNGSSGDNELGNVSIDKPNFTDLEPSKAGESNDGYIWKYLFTVSPSDIIKFDSTEYIPVPLDWSTSTDVNIKQIRENGNSDINKNQIKKVYIKNKGLNYSVPSDGGRCKIIGDGSGAEVVIQTNSIGEITSADVASGGSGYTYGVVDLGNFNNTVSIGGSFAELVPIIPPSKGHGFDIYKELGSDKILIYSRFDDSTKVFPVDTNFSQVGIIKNPTQWNSDVIYSGSTFSNLYAMILNEDNLTVTVGDEITQNVSDENGNSVKARGYVVSYDTETKVLKYSRDRSLYYKDSFTPKDYIGISSESSIYNFDPNGGIISPIGGTINNGINDSVITVDNKIIDLGSIFENGMTNPDINKSTGDIIYLNNRPTISRNSRQKEDIKVILEF
jgi:hypothetical protein